MIPRADCPESQTVVLVTSNDAGELDHSRTAEVEIIRHPASLRLILDRQGEDHDILIEQQDDHWGIYVHPNGGDPVCVIKLFANGVLIEDDFANTLLRTGQLDVENR